MEKSFMKFLKRRLIPASLVVCMAAGTVYTHDFYSATTPDDISDATSEEDGLLTGVKASAEGVTIQMEGQNIPTMNLVLKDPPPLIL